MDLPNALIYIIVLVIVVILIIVLFKFLIGIIAIAPAAYGAEPDDIVDKATISDNDTEITVTCTENIEGLVESCTD